VETELPDYYATLGLDRRCTLEQIRTAYRLLAKHHHPDLNGGSAEAELRTRALNEAHETLSDPDRRRAYDRELQECGEKRSAPSRGRIERNIAQDVQLRIDELLRGVSLDITVNDPANPDGPETYQLCVPPETAPGTRVRVPRTGVFQGGFVQVRVRVRPNARFKARGSDLRCDLRISAARAAQGGMETIVGATGSPVRVQIPPGTGRGEIIRIPHEGLPKPRGGRGDLLVKITYRPDVRVTRSNGWR
jgi:curved DNA-binding protein